jgi:hypothetical protein
MTDADLRVAGWDAVARRINDLAAALAATASVPMSAEDYATVQHALGDLDGVRSWFDGCLIPRVMATGYGPEWGGGPLHHCGMRQLPAPRAFPASPAG